MSYVLNSFKVNNMIMQDYAYIDYRSTAAMLKGRGDGREHMWLDFERNNPELGSENLIELFSKEVRYGGIPKNTMFVKCLSKKSYVFIMVLAAALI